MKGSQTNAARPNILFVFTDQQRADTIAAIGEGSYRTPALDRLCREGTAFLNAFTPSPVCVPARCSMMYGQYPHRTGCYENRFPMPEDDHPSFVASLSASGYRTHGVGKCHFTPDLNALRGFQTRDIQEHPPRFYGGGATSPDDYVLDLIRHGHGQDAAGAYGDIHDNKYVVPAPSTVPDEWHPARWVTNHSLEFLDTAEAQREPWFLFASYFSPHPPFCVPDGFWRPDAVAPPRTPPGCEALQTAWNRRQNGEWALDSADAVQRLRIEHGAMIAYLDAEIGRLLDAIEACRMTERTVVVFASDHGEYLGDYHCYGKRSMHDAAVRVPLIVRWPDRFSPGRRCPRPASLVDLAPTLLGLAGLACSSDDFDGVNLSELAAGRKDRAFVFSQHETGDQATFMAADERWKYFWSVPDAREFLFDRRQDPFETCNVASERPEALAALREALRVANPEFRAAASL